MYHGAGRKTLTPTPAQYQRKIKSATNHISLAINLLIEVNERTAARLLAEALGTIQQRTSEK